MTINRTANMHEHFLKHTHFLSFAKYQNVPTPTTATTAKNNIKIISSSISILYQKFHHKSKGVL
ncbi:hypothetical protein HCCG_00730 [Helicobacter cinaedi CCUG 18818 = ATCC BAA-847]|uniref:Uncharacterized protein n=1 Tax=Helicobacter cinaedi CCUG 18818 = ATCC BAA-847 TaxID=537971 RepID=A0ABN0B9B0_9HELI|nr:hypothetical protein HCCG_00730 [Helicobacter cinaedi CCUG 18818 = ATCC BAA-847]